MNLVIGWISKSKQDADCKFCTLDELINTLRDIIPDVEATFTVQEVDNEYYI